MKPAVKLRKQPCILQVFGGDILQLQDDLLKQFADAVNSETSGQPSDRTVYAEVTRVDGNTVYIKFDGSDIETPATSMVKVGVKDRVFASIKDHSVVITGNISYPSLTRVGEVYITLRGDGLLVGRLDKKTNWPVGTYIVVGTKEITIYNDKHEALSSFGVDTIELGKKSTALIKFCGGKAIIQLDDGTLRIRGGNSVSAIGLSNTYGNYRSEVVCEAKENSKRVGMQLLNGTSAISSVIVSENGVSVTVPSGKALTVNGKEVVKVNGVVATGLIRTGNKWINAHSEDVLRATISPPTGYSVVGVSGWSISGGPVSTSFMYISGNNQLEVVVGNLTDYGNNFSATIKWFAIRTTGVIDGGSQTIPW